MQEPSRLFDLPDYQLARFPQPDMLAGKVDGAWRADSTAEVIALVRSLAAGLLRLGIQGHDLTPEGQDKVAILSGNLPEWVIVDQALQQTGAVLVPIYPTINPLEHYPPEPANQRSYQTTSCVRCTHPVLRRRRVM